MAIALVLLVDTCVLPRALPWSRVEAAMDASHFGERGVARDYAALEALASAPPGKPRVVVLGSSRAEAGFRPEWLGPDDATPPALAKLAHPGMWIFAMRSHASALSAYDPAAVVFLLSDFELHSPLETTSYLSAGTLGAVVDLGRTGGAAWTWRERSTLLRLALVSLLESTRIRELLGRAALDPLRRFPLDARLAQQQPAWMLADTSQRRAPKEVLERVRASWQEHFTPEGVFAANMEIPQLLRVARGDHARIHGALLRSAARTLRAAGVRVLLVEAPMFPSASQLYDPSLRDDFLALGRSLADEEGVTFVPLESLPPFPPGDFSDLTHLDREGATKLTRSILEAVEAALGQRTKKS